MNIVQLASNVGMNEDAYSVCVWLKCGAVLCGDLGKVHLQDGVQKWVEVVEGDRTTVVGIAEISAIQVRPE